MYENLFGDLGLSGSNVVNARQKLSAVVNMLFQDSEPTKPINPTPIDDPVPVTDEPVVSPEVEDEVIIPKTTAVKTLDMGVANKLIDLIVKYKVKGIYPVTQGSNQYLAFQKRYFNKSKVIDLFKKWGFDLDINLLFDGAPIHNKYVYPIGTTTTGAPQFDQPFSSRWKDFPFPVKYYEKWDHTVRAGNMSSVTAAGLIGCFGGKAAGLNVLSVTNGGKQHCYLVMTSTAFNLLSKDKSLNQFKDITFVSAAKPSVGSVILNAYLPLKIDLNFVLCGIDTAATPIKGANIGNYTIEVPELTKADPNTVWNEFAAFFRDYGDALKPLLGLVPGIGPLLAAGVTVVIQAAKLANPGGRNYVIQWPDKAMIGAVITSDVYREAKTALRNMYGDVASEDPIAITLYCKIRSKLALPELLKLMQQ